MIFGIVGCFYTWAGSTQMLPGFLHFIWAILHLPVYFVTLMLDLPEFMTFPSAFIWWFLIGILINFVFAMVRK